MTKLADLFRSIRRLERSGLSNDMRRRILATYIRLSFLQKGDPINNIADVLGYKIKFCTFFGLSYLFEEIFISNEYHIVNLPKNAYIIDCGSNIGMSVLYFKILYPSSTVLAFEPDKDAFSCLEENIRVNNLQYTAPFNIALTDIEGPIDFFYDKDHPGFLRMSVKQDRMPKDKTTVRSSPLSHYIDKNVDLLKMDIEGSEQEVIQELSNSGKLHFVKQMIIEYHHHIAIDYDTLSVMLRQLENAGFGYQLQSSLMRPLQPKQFQDILIYAYQKQ